MTGTTKIFSNGGGQTLPIEALFDRLATDPLDRTFEPECYGSFIYKYEDGRTSFFGNFHTCSHVFNILTDDAELIARLTTAIRANQQRPDYLAQPDEAEQQRQAEEARRLKRVAMLDEHERKLTRELASIRSAKAAASTPKPAAPSAPRGSST
jgi:hypothetical protein